MATAGRQLSMPGRLLRLARIRPSARGALIGGAVAAFVILCVLPVVWMLVASFADAGGGFSTAHYRPSLFDARRRELLLNSTILGAGAAAFALLIGAPLGLLMARAELRLKRLLRLALVIPLVIPPYVLALAWVYLGGEAGGLARTFGRGLPSDWTYSLAGAAIIMGVAFFPVPMLATEAAARRVDGRLEEAALLVATRTRVLWRITLPLIAPAVTAAALIVFVLAVSEFGVPGLLRVRVYTTEVFTAFSALYDFGAATVLAVPLLVVALMAGVGVKIVVGERLLAARRSAYPGLKLPPGKWEAPALAGLALILCLFVALPLVALAREAGEIWPLFVAAQKGRGAISNSLFLSALSATLITALAIFLGYARGRARARFGGLIDLAFVVVFAVPSTVVGVGLIGLWNRPGIMGEIYTSPLIIGVAYLARFTPVAALILAAGARQVPISLEEAAVVAGASWPRMLTRIVFPQLKSTAAAAWCVSFIFSFGELGATVLVAPPGESTLPVRIYTLIANSPSSEVAGLALMQIAIVLIPLAFFGGLNGGVKRRG